MTSGDLFSMPGLQSADPASVSPVKCLLVDDLPENLLAMEALLRAPDVEVLTARSGSQALELLLAHDVALALVDVQMPEMDGFELAELMRGSERTRHVPIIFVTAGTHDQLRVFKGYDLGAVDFLHKPVESRILQHKAAVFYQLYRQRLLLQQQLSERNASLRMNEMFMAVLGHDLRSPLSAVVLSAARLKRHADPAVREAADRIRSSGARMEHMVSDLLDVVRSRQLGGLPLSREPIHLDQIVRTVVDECQLAWTDRAIDLQVCGAMQGQWDSARLSQLVANLIGNALTHGDRHTPVQIVLDGSAEDQVTLHITNEGEIAPEFRDSLFDPFRPSERRSRASNGLGLGLYIVQQVAHAHGGTVHACSQARRTHFKVDLPREVAT